MPFQITKWLPADAFFVVLAFEGVQGTVRAFEAWLAVLSIGILGHRLPDAGGQLLQLIGTHAVREAAGVLVLRGDGVQGVFAELVCLGTGIEGGSARGPFGHCTGRLPCLGLTHQSQALQGLLQDHIIQSPSRFKTPEQYPLVARCDSQGQLKDEGRRLCFRHSFHDIPTSWG